MIVSCKKEQLEETPAIETFKNGLLVVNEGLFQQNNASLSWIDLSTTKTNSQIFEQKNGRLLGDVANDIIRYGTKLYITVSTSSTLEILDANTGESISQINMIENSVPKQPREIRAFDGKVFVSCFDGYVDVLDTVNFTLLQRIRVGSNPEALLVKDNQLYVSNTGGLNYPNVDSTISIIDMNSLVETRKITVGKNPGPAVFDNQGNLYVITSKNINAYTTQLTRLLANTYQVDTNYAVNPTKIERMGANILVLQSNYSTTALHLLNCENRSFEQMNFIPTNLFHTLYNIQYDPIRQQIICYDAVGFTNMGYISIFNRSGELISKYNTGLCPTKSIIYE